ncbi:MAG: hypothetical protein D4R43_02520, partial [Sphingobacteriales bacterium]
SAAYVSIGSCFLKTSDYRQALEYYFKALELAERSRNNNLILLATKEVGVQASNSCSSKTFFFLLLQGRLNTIRNRALIPIRAI